MNSIKNGAKSKSALETEFENSHPIVMNNAGNREMM
jgi:hypothetical protein